MQQVRKRFIDRLITNFLDVIILAHFQEEIFSGYDVLKFISKEFGSLLSPGTVYSTLYAMERRKLVVCLYEDNKKRVYKVTEDGMFMLDVVTSHVEIESFIRRIF